jgi:hypothetical protein
MYDNHSSPCPDCCKHDKGFWLLKERYGEANGRWCCKSGCGYLKPIPKLNKKDKNQKIKGLRANKMDKATRKLILEGQLEVLELAEAKLALAGYHGGYIPELGIIPSKIEEIKKGLKGLDG